MSLSNILLAVCSLILVFSASAHAGSTIPSQNDINVLQYALTLENLENAFYTLGLQTFSASNFNAAGQPNYVYPYLQMVAGHEAAHVALLQQALGTAAVSPCSYNFSSAMTSVNAFLTTAALLETTGVQAYDGAINGITGSSYATVAATIATVEARHAAFLNYLVSGQPYPNSTDTAVSPTNIANAITPFLVNGSCNYNVSAVLPYVRPYGVTLNPSTNATIQTGSVPNAAYTAAMRTNDITTLNFALNLENLEYSLYLYGNSSFTQLQFAAAGYNTSIYQLIQLAIAQEAFHVATLSSTISARGYTPNVNCTYNFASITNVTIFLRTILALETAGAQAYDGAVNTITDTNLQQIAATIATVEARHAALLTLIVNGTSPFPYYLENATTPAQTLAAVQATGFITSCPASVNLNNLPVVAPLAYSSTAGPSSSSSSSTGGGGGVINPNTNDLNALQYALTLEHLEANFYTNGLAALSQAAFQSAGYGPQIYSYLTDIKNHEIAHVALLTLAINNAAGANIAVPECSYNFSSAFSSPANFLALAVTFEQTGQAAYDGAVNAITNAALQQVAATIATVEARHSAFLDVVTLTNPFPIASNNTASASDATLTPTQVITTLTSNNFITSCPYTVITPSIRPYGVAYSTNSQGYVNTGSNPTATYTTAMKNNDIAALQYALTLENFEAAFYAATVGTPSTAGPITATTFQQYGYSSYNFSLHQQIGAQEATHVQYLSSFLASLPGIIPNPACQYNFSSIGTNVTRYLAIATILENTGVAAYDGAVNAITDTNLQQLAAAIATIEARHAAYLQVEQNTNPPSSPWGPNFVSSTATDTALTPTQVLNAVSGLRDVNGAALFLGCSAYNPLSNLPSQAPAPYSSTGVSSSSSSTGNGAGAVYQVQTVFVTLFAILAASALLL